MSLLFNCIKRIVYASFCIERIINVFNYCVFYACYSGGYIFSIAETIYAITFQCFYGDTHSNNELIDNHWEDPEIFGRNRRKMHAPLRSFVSPKSAIQFWDLGGGENGRSLLKNISLLTGPPGSPELSSAWRFFLGGDPFSDETSWQSLDFDDSKWLELHLPNHWQLQGVDIPIYTNTTYPFRFDPPYTRRDGTWNATDCDKGIGGTALNQGNLSEKEPGYNSTGFFRKRFDIPIDWIDSLEDNRYFLVFEGVDSCIDVWIDGWYVGYSEDSALSCEFEITKYVAGENKNRLLIALKVLRFCSGSYLEVKGVFPIDTYVVTIS